MSTNLFITQVIQKETFRLRLENLSFICKTTYKSKFTSVGEECALPVPPEPGAPVSQTTFLLLVSLSVFLGLLFIIIFACMCHRATTICRTVNGLEQSDQCLW